MALPILDGNQSATTLSTIIDGGAHIPAHTVVSLGSQAISDITSAVSGSVVSVSNLPSTQTIAGTVTANGGDFTGVDGQPTPPLNSVQLGYYSSDAGSYLGIGDDIGLPVRVIAGSVISGTVTANNPNGALTTHFGSVTTANTAELTSAVTNSSRKYLLVQNIDSSTVTIGIGFAPTTTQGIQLSAGGGLTFDAFCPTGAVYWLSGVTGSNWSILEG